MWHVACSCGWRMEAERFEAARGLGERHADRCEHWGKVVVARAGDEGFYRVHWWGMYRIIPGLRKRGFLRTEAALKKSA